MELGREACESARHINSIKNAQTCVTEGHEKADELAKLAIKRYSVPLTAYTQSSADARDGGINR